MPLVKVSGKLLGELKDIKEREELSSLNDVINLILERAREGELWKASAKSVEKKEQFTNIT